jgi:hypothetical protein
MREIKFRAWDGRKFGYVSIGFDRLTWPSPDYFDQKFYGVREGSPEQVRFANVESFQQFTGLHDKEGEPIYEGDLVLYKLDKADTVLFEDGRFTLIRATGRMSEIKKGPAKRWEAQQYKQPKVRTYIDAEFWSTAAVVKTHIGFRMLGSTGESTRIYC